MSEWEYSPMENIAFALQDIANTLERIEKLMPVPGGEITTSEILIPKVEEVVETSTNEYEEALTDAIEQAKEKIDEEQD